ncbi:hypothetical protein BA195_06865 [Tenacibaculum soleae]|uniref:Uncharacterized protein n=2 Tax=Tenacibaculum soleae TaxID=447689 RepID=A0A1B9Y3L7_9FLAO|nr:hypothetical protein BA195_06865 [Tenacibaculum soleae]
MSVNLFSQVGIGTLTPSESSQLEITSNNKGVLIPRVNIDDLNTTAPITSQVVEESLLVYNTNTVSGKGFYYWAENKWNRLVDIDKVLNIIATHSDNQTITSFFLNNSNILTIEIENGGTATVDLSSLLNRNEVLTGAGSPIVNAINPLSGNLYIDVDNGNLYSSNGSIWISVTEKGVDGADGKTVLNGIGNPGRGVGGDNDFYINTTTNEIFGPKRAGQWGLGTSLVGPTGKKGKTVLNGIGNPGRGIGGDNDFYINTTTNEIFGPKRAGQWGLGTSLVGPVGKKGKTVLNGIGNPGRGVGEDNDFYINTTTNEIFGPKRAGQWGVGVSLVGAVGASGKTILNGNVIPTTEGVDGDFYVNTSTNMFYGPKASGSWGVGVSLVGAVGASGKTILNGNVIPTTEGVDGDFYVNTSTNMFYGPKVSGSWGVGVSLVGAVGASGKTILNGNVIPTTEGVDGDFYVNTSTNMFYGPKVSGSWGVGVSLVGAVGASGKTILNGNVIPTTEGVDGDFYVNTSTNMFYGPKVSGLWGVGVSLVGAVGASGKTILNGNVIPTTEGVDGDFYVNTSTNMFYGPKVSGSWGVGVSLVGAVGASGKTILNGNVIPTTEGVDGDFYVNTSTNMFYGPKVSGSWGVGVSLVGAVGASGKTILNGNVIPTTEGVDGDFYVNTSTNMFYGPKVSGSWGVGVSLVGASGKTILNGNVIPTTEGVDGDFYVNTSTNMFYGPKVSGSWGVGVSLVGASGVDGTLTGIVNPNGVLTGIAGQLYTNTVTGELYKTKDGITWELVDNDEQDMSLTGNIISLTKSLSTVDLSNSTLATSVTNNTTKIENLNRLNSIRVLTDPSSSTTILDSDGTVIIQNTALISLSLSPVLLPDPVISNVGRKITIVYRTSGLVSLGINVTTLSGGNRIKGSVLNALNVSVVGTNTSVTYQCGLDPDGTNYWYVVNKSLL